MAISSLFFTIVLLALAGVALYEHIHSVNLSLPLTPTLTVLTVLLPILGISSIFYVNRLSYQDAQPASRRGLIMPIISQTLQIVLITVLATLHFTSLVKSPTLNCSLATRWQELFSAHDGEAIRRIQDAFDCCGFNSVADREWPFHRNEPIVSCAERFGRTVSCASSWRQSLQQTAGVGFAVVIITSVLQIVAFLIARNSTPRQRYWWVDALRRSTSAALSETSRPLLADRESGNGGSEANSDQCESVSSYREPGPRLEPSRLPQETNEWNDV